MFSIGSAIMKPFQENAIIFRADPSKSIPITRENTNVEKSGMGGIHFDFVDEKKQYEKESTYYVYPRNTILTRVAVSPVMRENEVVNDPLGRYIEGQLNIQTRARLLTLDQFENRVSDIIKLRDKYWEVKQVAYISTTSFYSSRIILLSQDKLEQYGVIKNG